MKRKDLRELKEKRREIGRLIRVVRQENGLTLLDLANMAGYTASPAAKTARIHRFETGNLPLGPKIIPVLAELSDISEDEWWKMRRASTLRGQNQASLSPRGITTNEGQIGYDLLLAMRRENMAMTDLAKKTNLDISTIWRIIKGVRNLGTDVAITITEKVPELGLSAKDLLHKQCDYQLDLAMQRRNHSERSL